MRAPLLSRWAGHNADKAFWEGIVRRGTFQTKKRPPDAAGVDLEKPIITTCGSGVTATIISLALERIGHDRHSVYDGSWSEWGMYDGLKVETGG